MLANVQQATIKPIITGAVAPGSQNCTSLSLPVRQPGQNQIAALP